MRVADNADVTDSRNSSLSNQSGSWPDKWLLCACNRLFHGPTLEQVGITVQMSNAITPELSQVLKRPRNLASEPVVGNVQRSARGTRFQSETSRNRDKIVVEARHHTLTINELVRPILRVTPPQIHFRQGAAPWWENTIVQRRTTNN
jgi:hypothetical protein